MSWRRIVSNLIGAALLLAGLYLLYATTGLSAGELRDEALQTGLISTGLGLIWLTVDYFWHR